MYVSEKLVIGKLSFTMIRQFVSENFKISTVEGTIANKIMENIKVYWGDWAFEVIGL